MSLSALATTDALFFGPLERESAERELREATAGCDDGELFLEYRESETFTLEEGRIRTASFEAVRGFGLRAVCGEAVAYAHSGELSDTALGRAAALLPAVRQGYRGELALAPPSTNARLYSADNPLAEMDVAAKSAALLTLDAFARAADRRVVQVMASLAGEWQAVQILRPDGQRMADLRPLVRLAVTIVVESGGRRESGTYACGGRFGYTRLLEGGAWQRVVQEALRQAIVNLDSIAAPAGEMEVVLGPGWPGILLHEAVGHGLEGDYNRRHSSAFATLLGQRVAAAGVTVVDDGTIPDGRGSLTIDDEGTPTARTVLIEDGILVGYLQDRHNARLMKMPPTGNGRRQSYAHPPLPRMTNTFMLGGAYAPEEIIASVRRGIYAVNFGGGQVDITSGKFVFSTSEAYLLENGRIGPPLKGATLIGHGPDALTKVVMIGNDLALDPGVGTCGKQGQGVPVGVGQPTLRISGLTVGGTALG